MADEANTSVSIKLLYICNIYTVFNLYNTIAFVFQNSLYLFQPGKY